MKNKIIKMIQEITLDEDGEVHCNQVNEIVQKIESQPDPFIYISYIFEAFERFNDHEFGSPGAFVHFIESRKFKFDYHDQLIVSLKRKPSVMAVWMCNRIINSAQKQTEKQYWISVLKHAQTNKECSKDVNECIIGFLPGFELPT